jgi:hypothetical protein
MTNRFSDDDSSSTEQANAATSGRMKSKGSSVLNDNERRMDTRSGKIGLSLIIASYDWEKNHFCQHERCRQWREKGMELLGIPKGAESNINIDAISRAIGTSDALTARNTAEQASINHIKIMIGVSKSIHASQTPASTRRIQADEIFKRLRKDK